MASSNIRTFGAVLLVLLAAMAGGVGGAAADYTAPPSVDTSTTDDTSTKTGLAPGETRNYSATSNDTVQWISDSNSTELTLARNGSNYDAYVNGSAAVAFWNSTDADGHYNVTVNHSELVDVEHARGENVTMDMTFVNNTSAATTSTNTETWYLDFVDNETATEVVTTSEEGTDAFTLTNKSGWFAADTDKTEVSVTDAAAPNSTFYVVAANTSFASQLSDVQSNADGSESVAGLLAPGANAFVKVSNSENGTTYVPVYTSGNVPSDVTGTYAVVEDVGGTTGLAVHLGDDYRNVDSLDITAEAGTGTDIFEWRGYVLQNLPSLSMSLTGMSLPAIGGVALLAGRREVA